MPSAPVSKPEELTAAALLRIKVDEPERLFPPSAEEIKRIYRLLAKIWHPDYNKSPEAKDVFTHLNQLHEKAEEKLANNNWAEPGFFSYKLKDGKTLRVPSDVRREFDDGLGTMHIGPTTITYVVGRANEDLFQNAIQQIRGITFLDNDQRPDTKIEKTLKRCLPTDFKTYETDDAFILTIRKKPDDILLRDLLPLLPGDKRAAHIAWIMSRMHQMVRYLDHTGITHNAITLDTVFVSPREHSIGLFGGWWYAARYGAVLSSVPAEATEFLPNTGGKPILAYGKIDREMIRAAGREMLGDRGGTRLLMSKAAPQPMIDYLRLLSSGDAQKDFTEWYQNVLPKSFGARRFTELHVNYSDVYQPGG